MHLFGVVHNKKHFDKQVSEIEKICGVDDRVMMLELAPNYEENIKKGVLRPNFFVALAERYRSRCARVVAGDQELTIPESPDYILSCILGEDYFYPHNRRDETMRQAIERERPDIVIVGNGHSDEIKRQFSQVHYTVFQESGGYTARYSPNGGPNTWYRPTQIITI